MPTTQIALLMPAAVLALRVSGDLQYIGCQVCELVMESFYNATSTLYSTTGDGKVTASRSAEAR